MHKLNPISCKHNMPNTTLYYSFLDGQINHFVIYLAKKSLEYHKIQQSGQSQISMNL